jgi:hypothetical protein
MSSAECSTAASIALLVDYWAGDATTADAERLEDHAFACDSCWRRLAAVASLARGVARVAAMRGGLAMVVTQAMIDRLAGDGLKMRHYRPSPGQTVHCTIGPDDDLSVTYLAADFQDVRRVDVVFYAGGKEWARIDDAPIDHTTGQVIYVVGGDLARTFPAITVRLELRALRGGDTSVLGEYTFEHTPFAS